MNINIQSYKKEVFVVLKDNKKGALELSINAIVILILAITMLGLGLTFIRGIFENLQTKVSEAVSASELINPPTRDNVLTAAPGDITFRKGEKGEVVLAFMNAETASTSRYCKLSIVNTGGTNVANTIYSTKEVKMASEQINTWMLALSYNTGVTTTPVTGLYTATMTCGDASGPITNVASNNKDIVVTVMP